MALVARLARLVLEESDSLCAADTARALDALLPTEAPLAGAEVRLAVLDALHGMGPIEGLLRDPTVADVLVNGPGDVWVERNGRLERTSLRFEDDAAVVAAVERSIAPLGLRLDPGSPLVDARLPDGSRLHAAIPPVSIDGPVVAIRRFTGAVTDLQGLVEQGTATPEQAGRLRAAVVGRENIVVSGGTGAGKTTLLNALSAAIPAGERIVTVEDAAELQLRGHVVRLEARPANAEGVGAVPMEELVRAALRLRPDRLVVGEVRGAEALDMVTAVNTGHDGSMSTVHANSPDDALWRLETLALSGRRRVSAESVRRQLVSAIDLVVHIRRRDGIRTITSIAAVSESGCEEVAL